MVNDLRLQEGQCPPDENLRPIKVGGQATALETAKSGNGARVRGDLEVTGNIKGNVKDVELDLSQINSTDLTIDDAGSISLDATSGSTTTGLLFKNAGTLIGDVTVHHSATYLRLYENGGASDDDYFDIKCEANGASTLSTVDGSGNIAHLILDVDGRLILDSSTGAFSVKNAGTEFSVANSSYAGMILGYKTIGIDAADSSYAVTNSFATVGISHKVKFVAPPSGAVEVEVFIYADASSGGRPLKFGLSDNVTYSPIDFPNSDDVTNEHEVATVDETDEKSINHKWVVTGLTAGTAYEWWLGAASSHGFVWILRWGGNVTGEYAPFIMKVTALPTAVADYAVYG